MKKILALLLAISLLMLLMVGCSTKPGDTVEASEDDVVEVSEEAVEGEAVKLGLGAVTSIAKSKDYNLDADGKETLALGQVDTVIVAATFDNDGKVVGVTIDNAQTRVNFDKDLKVTNDKSDEIKTKVELGDAYGMINASGIGKEWYQQIAELENWMVGKTVDEIKAMKVKEVDASHPAVPDVPELTSLVTITIQDYILALEKAYNNAVDIEGAEKLGLGHKVSIAKSKDYSKDVDGKETLPVAQVDTVMTATAFDKDGKVVGTVIDTAQTRVNFDADGKITSDKAAEIKTKVELGDAYGMGNVSGIGKEWYQQIAELEDWMVGKTVDEITAMTTEEGVAELTSSVTISIQDYIAVVEEAFNKAR